MTDALVTEGLGFALALFALGLYPVVAKESLLRVLLGIEIMGQAVTLSFLTAGYALGQPATAQAIAFTAIAIEVAFTAVALALMIALYRKTGRIDVAAMRGLAG